jgi:outer membrane protein assembly factor BamB
MFRGDPANRATGSSGPTNLALKWKFETNGLVISSPTLVDGVAYVGSQDKNIYALDADTGNKIWNFATDFRVRSSPAVVDGKVYTGADDGNIYCLNAEDGTQLWKTPAGGITMLSGEEYRQKAVPHIRSSPTVVGDMVYVGSLDKNLYCLNANSGNVIWKFSTLGAITSTPAVVDGAVYITSSNPSPSTNGTLFKLDAYDGSVIWQLGIPYERNSPDMHASPIVADDMVFIPADAKYYYCINATTSTIKWKYQCVLNQYIYEYQYGSMLYAENKVYVADQFFLSCLNATDGERIWRTWLAREIYSSPSYAFGKVYVGTDEGTVHVLNAASGEKLSNYHPGIQIWSSPTLYMDRMYVGAHDWNVYCFEEADLGLTTYYGSPTPEPTPTPAPTPTPTPEPTPAPMTDTYILGSTIAILAGLAIAVFLILRKK